MLVLVTEIFRCPTFALGQKQTLTTSPFAPLLRASAAFRYAPVFCGFSDVVRARIIKAAIACQNIASA
jgi:hypothetical protein